MGESSGWILAGIGAYVAAVLGIGFAASRRITDDADYVVAGRRLPVSLCTFTLFATWFGGGTCIGAAGAAFSEGLPGVIADPFGAGLCLLLFGLFYAGVLRRMQLLTIADYFRVRFGESAELLASLCLLPAYLGWVGSQFVAFGFILNALTGMDTTAAIWIGAAVVVVYTVAGGLWAVTLTDVVQGVVLVVGLAVLLPVVLGAAGGLDAALARLPAERLEMLPDTTLRDWLWYLQAWLVIGLGAIPSQDLVQRGLAARDERVARQSAVLAGLAYWSFALIPVALGLLGSLLLPDLDNPELILPALCLEYLPPVGVALVLGALLSAIMSSADSALLAPASILGENLVRRFARDPSPGVSLRVARLSVPLFALASLAIGLWFETVYDLMVNSWSVLLVSLLVPLTAGLYWPRATRAGALAGIGVGLASWIGLSLLQSAWPADLLATALAAAALVAVSLRTPHPPPGGRGKLRRAAWRGWQRSSRRNAKC